MHGLDGLTPADETFETLDTMVRSGKVRYIACSNFSGWHLMKSLATSEKYGWARYVAHVEAIDVIAKQTGKSVSQIALNWLLQRPTVSSVIVGARNEEQLRQNLGAADWNLTSEQVAALDAASATTPVYSYWFQRQFAELITLPVGDALAA